MHEIEQAQGLIREKVKVLGTERISLEEGLGRVLSKDVYATLSLPPFRQSAMDGYAIKVESTEVKELSLGSTIQAGDSLPQSLENMQAVRVFTGAPVPSNADAVIMQEYVEESEGKIYIQKEYAFKANIREIGEQIREGELALTKGTELNAAGMGYLQSFGIEEIEVFKNPSIHLVVSGNELVHSGDVLKEGQIYESNSITLKSALKGQGYTLNQISYVKDDLELTIQSFKNALDASDVLLVSGGISVGKYDFAKKAFEELGVEEVFYKVNQKPGKPIYFGKIGEKLVFGLPGNPASALVCLTMYVLPALGLLQGKDFFNGRKRMLPLKESFYRKGDRPVYVKAIMDRDGVKVLQGQQSSMLHTYALANALALIPKEKDEFEVGDLVEVYSII